MLELVWVCRFLGDPAGEGRPGGTATAFSAVGDFWGVPASEIILGNSEAGCSGGRDWALAAGLWGEPHCWGLKKALGFKKDKEESERKKK